MHLIIDNYDSFTYNIVQYLGMLNADVVVRRSDEITLNEIKVMGPTSLIVSPGPCTPNEAGISVKAIKYFASRIPILGVCLGHQCITQAFGGQVRRANAVLHGKTSCIQHSETGLFEGIPQNVVVARYHSLVVDNLPECLAVTARESTNNSSGEIMAIEHCDYPIYGLQFHPESILTDYGLKMMANYLAKVDEHVGLMAS